MTAFYLTVIKRIRPLPHRK